jgi:hypothetical protein
MQLTRNVDTARTVRESQIHDGNRGSIARGGRQRTCAIVRDCGYPVPCLFHQILQVDGNQHLIFDD